MTPACPRSLARRYSDAERFAARASIASITVPFRIPIANPAAGQLRPNIGLGRPHGTNHINNGDFVIFDGSNAGYIVTAAGNPAVVLGIAERDSNATYDQVTTGLQGVFGASVRTVLKVCI